MSETARSSFIPEGDITRDYIWDTLRNWAEAAPHWQQILDIEIDTKTVLKNDVYFIDDAKIPAIALPRQDEAPETGETSEGKQLTVEMLSGQVVQIKVPAPHTVTQVKQCLEPRLGIPAFLQGIIAGAEELPDEAVVTGDAVAFLQREPPMIEAEDFLYSMVDMSWGPDDIFYKWHAFDTYKKFPRLQSELLEWALTHRNMQNVPLSTDRVLGVLDVWLDQNYLSNRPQQRWKNIPFGSIWQEHILKSSRTMWIRSLRSCAIAATARPCWWPTTSLLATTMT
ncbi:unnamed protein product [Symbiodinium sp. CCMP2456]|nr:unnamed protein product [Symbiodinium sp. CCMP2456]